MCDATIERAYAFLRGHNTGELRFEEHLRPTRYVIAPDGRLVAPAMVAMLQSVDTVLFVPECADGAMEVQVTLEELDEHGPHGSLTDRWRIYHGEPKDVRWAFMDVDAARFDRLVIDGVVLVRPNPLAADEPRLCKQLNQLGRDSLRSLCLAGAHAKVEEPVMVGVDPLGIDIRGRFDVFRVPFGTPAQTGDDAERMVNTMLEQAGSVGDAKVE